MSTEKSLGQVGYEEYAETGEEKRWQTFDGRPMPSWAALGESPGGRLTQRRWEAGAAKIVAESKARERREEPGPSTEDPVTPRH